MVVGCAEQYIMDDIVVSGCGKAGMISILHNTTQKEQVTLQSQHEVVIESIPSTSPELIVSPSLSSSELDGEGMIDVSGGRLLILQVDIVLANSPSLIFVRMVGGDLTIKTCSFVGPKGNAASNNVDSSSFLCDWETGFLKLMDATTTITVTQMSHLSQGAINMKNGKLTMETCTFHDNSPPSISFSSLRHNIRCSEEGEIEIESLSAGDGMETPSAWISATDCSLAAKEEISRSPFFVPTLSSSSTSKLSKDKTGFDVTIEGTTLIPCSLFLEVFEKKKDGTEGQQKQVPLTQELASHFNDTSIVVSLPLSSLSSFDDSLEWRGRLAFGNDQITASSFVIQLSAAGRRSQAVLENMKWWLPLVIVLSLLLVIVVVVVIICWRRRRIQKNPTTMEEMKESTQLQMEDEKMDIVTDNRIGVLSIQTCAPSESNADTTQLNAPKSSDGLHDFENVEEALPCCGDMKNTVYVSKDRTLYNALHSENKWDVRIRQAQLQLVKGLKEVEKKDRTAAILRALTAHNILFDSKENVCLKMNPDVTTHTHRPTWTQQTPPDQHTQQEQPEQGSTMGTNESKQIVAPQTERVNEGVRWLAPEVIENKPHINSGHGAVFSLGLILWEMETGSVPFGEQDAVNASRQIVTGVVPKLELVENAEMRELISQCLSLEPDDRPDFDTIESTLSLIPAGQSINPKEFVQS
ncbi:hypothetical protein BLNAU_10546 [Blattamonas nauphoetae]|uniref:Protein kinase domain-containing protein n=1 Tax=Blattamonas nauphoetae TaxID=2049346 RepID=A0ABQ9XQW1_9EUKA|nr:hypothetical protein BLNAU_10546 [Blattamonas nauphoetae]